MCMYIYKLIGERKILMVQLYQIKKHGTKQILIKKKMIV